MSIKISLSDFLSFNGTKSQPAKRHFVQHLQKRPDYNPAFDYWKDLRDGIKKLGKGDITLEAIETIAKNEPETKHKRENYVKAVSTFNHFLREKSPSLFTVDSLKSVWNLEDKLEVNASPEIGMSINGVEYLVKIYYKVKDSNIAITKSNTTATSAMLKQSMLGIGEKRPCALLNLQNGKFITEKKEDFEDDVMDLELEALNFINTWNRVLNRNRS